jgi:hypothetical protein
MRGPPAMPLRAQPRSQAMWCPALRLVCRWATVMPLARSAPVGYRPGGANRWHATNVVEWGVACTRLRARVVGGREALNRCRACDRNGSAFGPRTYDADR